MNGPALSPGTVPVGPLLSMYDPIFIGVDEFGAPVYTKLIYRNLLAAGEPGGGKSGLLNTFAAHAALSIRNRIVLFDGKQVELGMWDDLADEFVGPDLDHAIITLRRLQKVMDNRYTWLRAHRRRKIEPTDRRQRHHLDLRRDRPVLHRPGHRDPATRIRGAVPGSGRPRPRRRHARHRRHPAAQRGHHPQKRPGPVRLPGRLPLHQHRQQQHHPRRRLVRGRLRRHHHHPHQPRRGVPDRRRRRPPEDQGRLPDRRAHHRPGRPRRLDPPHPGTPSLRPPVITPATVHVA